MEVEWSASRSGCFTIAVNRPQHPLVGGYVCPRVSLGGIEKIEIFVGNRTQTFQSVTIFTELSRLSKKCMDITYISYVSESR
jgi:hypothetical protein